MSHRFEKKITHPLPDCGATGFLYRHRDFGLRVIFLKSEDPFKVFAAGFPTHPWSNGGEAHLVEHLILSGSDRYPSQDLMTEMDALSLNAYLNATTYPDQTVFPLASVNDRDFENLTRIYVDAIFCPQFLKDPRLFKREGWHYELSGTQETLQLNGVVYNEMKGACADPVRVLTLEASRALFPDTFYAYHAGGDPEGIRQVTPQKVKDFYRTFYTPEKAVFYFYGNLDIDSYLYWIEEEYLSARKKEGETGVNHPGIRGAVQPSFKQRRYHQGVYQQASVTQGKNGCYFAYNCLAGSGGQTKEYWMLDVLSDVLGDAASSPIRKRLMENGIGEDYGSLSYFGHQNAFGIAVQNAAESQLRDFETVVDEELRDISAKGLDRDQIKATLNRMELSAREANAYDGLKGLDYLDRILNSYWFGGEPFEHLEVTTLFQELHQAAERGEFEQFVRNRLTDQPTSAITLLRPEKDLLQRMEERTQIYLSDVQGRMTLEQRQAVLEETKEWQKPLEPDQASHSNPSLPLLSLKNLNPQWQDLDYEKQEAGGVQFLRHERKTGGINYLSLQFDASTLPLEEWPWVSLLTDLLGELPTQKYSYDELEKQIDLHTGGIGFSVMNSERKKSAGEDFRFQVSARGKKEQIDATLDLIREMTQETFWDDQQRLKYLLTQLCSDLEQRCISAPQALAVNRVRASFSRTFRHREMIGGIDYLRFVQKLKREFPHKAEEFAGHLRNTMQSILCRKNLYAGLVAESGCDLDFLQTRISRLSGELLSSNCSLATEKHEDFLTGTNEGLRMPVSVHSVAMGGSWPSSEGDNLGIPRLISHLLDNLYLFPIIRGQGGAYGAYSLVDNYRNCVFYSERDPHLEETLKTFVQAGHFIQILTLTQSELDALKIGYFKTYPRTPGATVGEMVYREINGVNNEDYRQEAEAIISATAETLRQKGEILEEIMKKGSICVAGSGESLQRMAPRLGRMIDIPE